MPWLIGLLMLFFTSINLFRVFSGQKIRNAIEPERKEKRPNFRASFGIAASVFVYPFLLHNLKFILATFMAAFSMLFFLRYKKVLLLFLISMMVAVISFFIFSLLLGVTVPGGVLEQVLLRLL